MKKKVYVLEERGGFSDWKPKDANSIKKGAESSMMMWRQLARIYKTNKVYRIRTYIPLEDKR